MSELLNIYRERSGDPAFWGEPVNAMTNSSFLIAAVFAMQLAIQRQALTTTTVTLISLAAMIGVGSFLFHTAVSPLTMWLDVIPIAILQTLFLWLACREMLSLGELRSAAVVTAVLLLSFALMPVHRLLNGSLFYAPSLVAFLWLGYSLSQRSISEPWLVLSAAVCFYLAVTARTFDWIVPWAVGSHYLWHMLNGVVVYLALRSWILHVSQLRLSEG
ncbi:MAG: ceramidase domain-containing protein [Planctomyces sp.]|nr:ceramidase domain-containing protein [Planctomyces sp.]